MGQKTPGGATPARAGTGHSGPHRRLSKGRRLLLALIATAAIPASSPALHAEGTRTDRSPASQVSPSSLSTRPVASAPSARPGTQPSTQRTAAADVSVDPRAELMSVIFRLAGNPEYSRAKVDSYAKDADKHFAPYKDHAVVVLARKLRATRGVSYDAPMSLVPHLTAPPELKEKVSFEPRPEGLDGRWRIDELREFLHEARRFAQDSNFEAFLKAHGELYETAVERMKATMAREGHLEWFDAFFGPGSKPRFRIYLSMLNGGSCYGVRLVGGKETEMYCILGVWDCDDKGRPRFLRSVMPTVVHEFAHSYVNPAVSARAKDFEPAGKVIFPQVQKAMSRQAYGNWQTVVIESVVRAAVVLYRSTNEGITASANEIRDQQDLGFIWCGDLVRLLADYQGHRDKYPAFDAFMPRIVQFFDQYAREKP